MKPKADLQHEWALRQKGHTLIAGLDEAGRGAWAGPVVVGAVILPLERLDLIQALDGVRDSKQVSEGRRPKLIPRILEVAVAASVGHATHWEIDEYGIVPATRLAMRRALDLLAVQPDALLTDAIQLPESGLPCTPLIKGDQRSLSIAAASILAKVARDRFMVELDDLWPQYGFRAHKGYGTPYHQQTLHNFGPAEIHRYTFKPVYVALDRTEIGDTDEHR
jgi:ribonuclease HII